MNKPTWTINETNVNKIIARLENGGRKVDHHIAMIIYRKFFENKAIEAEYCGTVCDMFTAMIWNHGAVN